MKLFYLIWADAILSFKRNNPKRKDWKITLLLYLSFIFALNFWILLLWLKFFNILIIEMPKIRLFPGDILNDFLGFVIVFVLPFIIANYLLIFYKNRYQHIVNKYKNYNYKYALVYSLSIIGMTVFSAFLYGFLTS